MSSSQARELLKEMQVVMEEQHIDEIWLMPAHSTPVIGWLSNGPKRVVWPPREPCKAPDWAHDAITALRTWNARVAQLPEQDLREALGVDLDEDPIVSFQGDTGGMTVTMRRFRVG